jgi:hypothetical protein
MSLARQIAEQIVRQTARQIATQRAALGAVLTSRPSGVRAVPAKRHQKPGPIPLRRSVPNPRSAVPHLGRYSGGPPVRGHDSPIKNPGLAKSYSIHEASRKWANLLKTNVGDPFYSIQKRTFSNALFAMPSALDREPRPSARVPAPLVLQGSGVATSSSSPTEATREVRRLNSGSLPPDVFVSFRRRYAPILSERFLCACVVELFCCLGAS